MIEQLIQEIATHKPLLPQEKTELQTLLVRIKEQTEKMALSLSHDRWMALAVHVLAFMRRMEEGECLPPVEQELWDQVSEEMKGLSRKVLEAYGRDKNLNITNIEILLLALHFAAAKLEQQEDTK
ncbi:PRD domain-containing protein [Laceyella putida]|uniref:PRD domain-containing protein n=1 Tax=Laceyella putida TaxID=110101 RepID=A0ABW2RP81_9BACL